MNNQLNINEEKRTKSRWGIDFFKFSLEGRYGRLNYLNGALIILAITGIIEGFASLPSAKEYFFTIPILFSYYWAWRICILRGKDIGISPLLCTMFSIIPLIFLMIMALISPNFTGDYFSILRDPFKHLEGTGSYLYWTIAIYSIAMLFGIYLQFTRGDHAKNRYGEPPLQGSRAGVYIACVLLGMLLLLMVLSLTVLYIQNSQLNC